MGSGEGNLQTIGTIGGAVAGGLLGGPAGAAAGASIGGSLGAMFGGNPAAASQQRIAEAQLEEQRRTRELATRAAEPSAAEIAQLQQSINLNNQDISRKEKLLASSDPALIEAGNQALKLLQGAESGVLSPIRNQRAKERAILEERLRSQLGSGYANTTAGIQALSAFDQGTSDSLAMAQQNSLSQLLGVAQNVSAQGLQSNITNSQNIANIFGNQSNRMVSAINATPITAVGAQYVGDLANAQYQTATMNNLMNAGVTMGSAYLGAQGAKS